MNAPEDVATKKPPELREQVARILADDNHYGNEWDMGNLAVREKYLREADRVIQLIRADEQMLILAQLKAHGDICYEAGRKYERERIINQLNNLCDRELMESQG